MTNPLFVIGAAVAVRKTVAWWRICLLRAGLRCGLAKIEVWRLRPSEGYSSCSQFCVCRPGNLGEVLELIGHKGHAQRDRVGRYQFVEMVFFLVARGETDRPAGLSGGVV